MAASVPPPWIPEDDLLLKKAVEAGASLEALAKGAVRFSRKFTVGELRDRWHSLLYDPIISAEASARMVEFERSAANSKMNVSLKRKLQTVRQMYYAMRKKTCSRPGNSSSFSCRDNMAIDSPEQCGSCLFGETNQNQVGCYNELPLEIPPFEQALSDSLFNFPNEYQPLLVDADGEDTIGKSFHDGILMNCPNDVFGSALGVQESQTLVSDKSIGVPTEREAPPEGSLSQDVVQHGHFCSEINLPSSTSAENTWSAKQCDVEMECTLNSEDPEIPWNDHVFIPKKITSSIIATTSKRVGYPCLLYANLKDDKQEQCLMKKEENPPQSLIALQITALNTLPVTNPGSQPAVCGFKCKLPCDVASGQASNVHGDPNQCRTAKETPNSATVGLQNAETLHACNAMGSPFYAKACSPEQVTSLPEVGSLTLNQEESESEDDVPSYSDIEAMILGMDLCPDDTDSNISSEVSRYQNEDTRRTIIRLEQCARSSMQRNIASRGAFAVLYGHYLKHYIRETEVILGRSTDDMEVDIDLGREGPAKKISRRQALIKMEADGSFLLKNLGKILVFLNGKEVATGQSMRLGSSTLIEIGGMAFVFEINSKSVGRHLANATKNRQQNNIKFEWSEGVS